jgi:hypothetical protein
MPERYRNLIPVSKGNRGKTINTTPCLPGWPASDCTWLPQSFFSSTTIGISLAKLNHRTLLSTPPPKKWKRLSVTALPRARATLHCTGIYQVCSLTSSSLPCTTPAYTRSQSYGRESQRRRFYNYNFTITSVIYECNFKSANLHASLNHKANACSCLLQIKLHALFPGCQMVYFNTKPRNFDMFWKALEWKFVISLKDHLV